MTHDAGIDVSLETRRICLVDGSGELRAANEPEALAAALIRGGPGIQPHWP